jgi:hypothetical protein
MRTARLSLLIVIGVGLAALLVGIVIDASGSARRQSGSNLWGDPLVVATLQPGQRLCQPALLPGDTDAVRVRASTGNPLRLDAAVLRRGATLTSGSVAAPAGERHVQIPLKRVDHTVFSTQVCVVNRGPAQVSLWGFPTPPKLAPTVDGKKQLGAVRFQFTRPGSESWWQLLPTLWHRYGVGKSSWVGSWTMLLTALLTLLGSALVVRTLLREEKA